MPKPTLEEFLADPKHKEDRDFLTGAIDARVKEIATEWDKEKRKRKESEGDDDEPNKDDAGSFFDHLFDWSKKK